VISHDHIGVQPSSMAPHHRKHSCQKRLGGPFGCVDTAAIVAPIDHVVKGYFILYAHAHTAGHVSIVGIPRLMQ
jgi:hypothetical protein